ncbi:MAG: hypothetical protein ACJ8G3_13985, partial [Burkholderiaceae bacterium]
PGSPFFGYFFWRSKKSDPAAGTESRLVSTAVQQHCVTRQGTGSTIVFDVDVSRQTAHCTLHTANCTLQTATATAASQ